MIIGIKLVWNENKTFNVNIESKWKLELRQGCQIAFITYWTLVQLKWPKFQHISLFLHFLGTISGPKPLPFHWKSTSLSTPKKRFLPGSQYAVGFTCSHSYFHIPPVSQYLLIPRYVSIDANYFPLTQAIKQFPPPPLFAGHFHVELSKSSAPPRFRSQLNETQKKLSFTINFPWISFSS